jgi:hypothetical protein
MAGPALKVHLVHKAILAVLDKTVPLVMPEHPHSLPQALRAILEFQANKVPRVLQVNQETMAERVPQADLAKKAHVAQTADQVKMGTTATKVNQEPMAHKANAVFVPNIVLWMVVFSSRMVLDAKH